MTNSERAQKLASVRLHYKAAQKRLVAATIELQDLEGFDSTVKETKEVIGDLSVALELLK